MNQCIQCERQMGDWDHPNDYRTCRRCRRGHVPEGSRYYEEPDTHPERPRDRQGRWEGVQG